jgi:6,7-dimethyl-8-ribityllumazine synthase
MVRLGLVIARFNAPVTGAMADRARDRAAEQDATIVAETAVPGAYDTPLAADRLARREDVDGVVAVGAIVSGATDHEHVIAEAAAQGLTDVSLDRDTPVTLGIAGPGMTAEQARDRVDYAADAVDAAIDLVTGADPADSTAGNAAREHAAEPRGKRKG